MHVSRTLRLATGVIGALALGGPALGATVPPLPELRFAQVTDPKAQLDGDRISYLEAGPKDAPPLLLLHGIGAHAGGFRYQLAGLSDSFRVIAWNAPGHILSENFKPDSPSCDDYADAAIAFLDAMKIGKVHVVGSSLGSMHATCLASRHPDRVNKVALIGVPLGLKGQPPERITAALAAREKRILEEGPINNAPASAERLAGSKASPEAKELMLEMLKGINRKGYIQAGRMAVEVNLLERAPAVQAPVLLIIGSEDRNAPMDNNAVPLSKALKTARLEVLEGNGHLPEIENPERVNALLRDFLK